MEQYYAHPRNQFWHLIGEVVGVNLADLPYHSRLQSLLDHDIGLWDVINEATRPGSLDTRISGAVPNDLDSLLEDMPRLTAIAFNGKTASWIGRRQLTAAGSMLDDKTLLDLPSSSPAYTLSYSEKAQSWNVLKKFIRQ